MRLGLNPNKYASAHYLPKDVTVAMMVYIPSLTGYFEHRLEILKISIASIVKHTEAPYDLLVFDNGSCSEVLQYLLDLRDAGTIQYLMLSRENLGIAGGNNVIFSAAPGQFIVKTDDDIFFRPGWLQAQLQILQTFPHVGLVSGLPMWHNFARDTQNTLRLAESDPSVTVDRAKGWPRDWAEEYCESTGRDIGSYLEFCKDIEINKLTHEGISAFATASDCQFVTRKSIMSSILPFESRKTMGLNVVNIAANAGLMGLSTLTPNVYHMGNRLSPRTRHLVAEYGLNMALPDVAVGNLPPAVNWLLRRGRIKRLVKRVQSKLFEWLMLAEGKIVEGRK